MAEGGKVIKTIIKTVMKTEKMDSIIVHLNLQVVEGRFGRGALDNMVEAISELSSLPINVTVVLRNEMAELEVPRVKYAKQISDLGIPVLFNLNSTISSLGKMIEVQYSQNVDHLDKVIKS